jgi:hypothetical protein
MPARVEQLSDDNQFFQGFIFPGSMFFLRDEHLRDVATKVLLIHCNRNDQYSDVYVCQDDKENSLGLEIDQQVGFNIERLLGRVEEEAPLVIDMADIDPPLARAWRELGDMVKPARFMLSHTAVMANN